MSALSRSPLTVPTHSFVPVAAAAAALLYPHAEVVLHDRASDRIVAIWNAFSARRAGDPSQLGENHTAYSADSVLGPYEKTGTTGTRLKSVTAVLPALHPGDPPVGLLCINIDVTYMADAARVLAEFVAPGQDRPPALFAQDWREATRSVLQNWLADRGLSASALSRAERIQLVRVLDERGLFEAKRAAEHVGALIGVSRATVYTYLAEVRRAKAQSD
jgi:D-arginine utilization repressor